MRSDSVIPVGIRQIERCVVAVTGTRKLVVRYQRTKRKGEKGKERVTNPLTSVTYLLCMIRALTRDARLVNGDLHTVRVAIHRSLEACPGAERPMNLLQWNSWKYSTHGVQRYDTSVNRKRTFRESGHVLYIRDRSTCTDIPPS